MAKGRGWLQITINLSAFEEGNKTMNAMEVMDIFWKIMDQQKEPKASGRVPEDVHHFHTVQSLLTLFECTKVNVHL